MNFPFDKDKLFSLAKKITEEYPVDTKRSIALNILHNIKKRNYYCTKKEYDWLKKYVNNEHKDFVVSTKKVEDDKWYTHIKRSVLEGFYDNLVKVLKYNHYHFFKKLLTNIKKREGDMVPVTQKEYDLLMNLKNGTISQEDYPPNT